MQFFPPRLSRNALVPSRSNQAHLSTDEQRVLQLLHKSSGSQVRNPEARHLVAVLADTSGSMEGKPISELNDVLQHRFAPEIAADPLIAGSVLVGLFGFTMPGASQAFSVLHPFAPPWQFKPPVLAAKNGTPHCQRIVEMISLLATLSAAVRKAFEVPVRHSWLFDLTDGRSEDLQLRGDAVQAAKIIAPANDIECFFFGVGPRADMAYLHSLEQPGRTAMRLNSAGDFREFFGWLHRSMRVVSQNPTGGTSELPDLFGNSFATGT